MKWRWSLSLPLILIFFLQEEGLEAFEVGTTGIKLPFLSENISSIIFFVGVCIGQSETVNGYELLGVKRYW